MKNINTDKIVNKLAAAFVVEFNNIPRVVEATLQKFGFYTRIVQNIDRKDDDDWVRVAERVNIGEGCDFSIYLTGDGIYIEVVKDSHEAEAPYICARLDINHRTAAVEIDTYPF